LVIVLIDDAKNHSLVCWPDNEDDNPELIDLRGQIPTEDLPGLLAAAKLIISNDSGTYHLGVSLGRPTIAVGGSGIPVRYFPYPHESTLHTKVLYQPVPCAGCNWRCIHTPSRAETAWCLHQVTWQEVVATADQLLRPTS
jgi:ADP-heptose:LPS heptosyltransferase